MAEFKDKVIIVTGGGNGIGAATVLLFLELGANVAVLDIRESHAATRKERLDIKCDVTSEDSVDQAIKRVVDQWGTIDVLVNCAGAVDNLEDVGSTTNATWSKCMNINVNGPFFLIRATMPFFEKAGKGSIVNVCSVASVRGAAAGAAYTTSKHALLGLSRNTAWMYAKKGIRCNAVLPSGVMTNLMDNSGAKMDPAGKEILGPYFAAMPGVSKPEDMARAIAFVAGAEALNGTELHADRGWTTA